MKKILFLLCLSVITFGAVCLAAAPEPSQKVFLFYKVPDEVLKCQNVDEDMQAGAAELEKELVNHYGKRFIVQGIERIPPDIKPSAAEYCAKVQPGQIPFFVKIELHGQGQASTLYQNAYGAQAVGIAPAVNVRLIEAIADGDNDTFYLYDYGTQSYSAGTFALGRKIYTTQKDPRINTKNAVRGTFRDACKFNETINKYADPAAYEQEFDRFTGNLKELSIAQEKALNEQNARIEKFKEWCNADETRKGYLMPLNSNNSRAFVIAYIDNLIKTGIYKE
jgi:hypothetical protein